MTASQPSPSSALQHLVARSPFGTFFGISQEAHDRVWAALTAPSGNSVVYVSMEIGADRDVCNPVGEYLRRQGVDRVDDPALAALVQPFLQGPLKLPIYSGGLGILAGDTLKSAADCRLPVAAVSLMYRKGYFTQLVDSQVGQIAWSAAWEPEKVPSLYLLKSPQAPDRPLVVEVPFLDHQGRTVMAYPQVWLNLEINDGLDSFVPELFLDYSGEGSPDWIQRAAERLYDSSSERVKAIQRRMLGAGVLPVMHALGLTARTIHLNEQHGVVLVLHLIAEELAERLGPEYPRLAGDQDILQAAAKVAQRVVYTIHTPVKAGHDRFSRTLYAEIGHDFCARALELLAVDEDNRDLFNFTALAMRVNRATNAVSRLHREVTKRQFPQYADKITAVTNGVHHLTWISEAKAKVFDATPALANWRNDPEVFATPLLIDDQVFRAALEKAWAEDTGRLVDFVNNMLVMHRRLMQETWIDPPNYLSHLPVRDSRLDPGAFTIGFARRFSTYKRADLIFSDREAMARIIREHNRPVNFLFAGKAHPSDEPGKSLIKHILAAQEDLYQKTGGLLKLVFIPGYDMALAKLMVAGVHAWLNNPKRPLEASGTSGMKAAVNGVPNISILDGWWVEGYHRGRTGWKFGSEMPVDAASLSEDQGSLQYAEDSASFYRIFPEILADFYEPARRSRYIDRCVMNLVLNTPVFNTHRMIAEYASRYQLDLSPPLARMMTRLRALYQSEQEPEA
ncbi:MAG: alpha-glucan family phosphorylase [Thermodesulfobacteriota bacterium]